MANNFRKICDAVSLLFKSTEGVEGVHTPHVNVDSMPAVEIGTIPAVEVSALPAVEVSTLPAVNVLTLPAQHIDAFNRIRTSDPGYRFDSQFTNQIDSDLWDSLVTDDGAAGNASDGTIAHDATNRMAVLTAKSGNEGERKCVLQSHYHSPYTPGRGQLAIVTGIMGAAPVAGGEVGMGYFDGFNGAYIRRDSTGVYIGIKTTTAAPDEEVEQEFWNVDSLGAGQLNPSGITLNLEKGCILEVPIQALYLGRVTFAMNIGGQIIPIHTFDHANELDVPYIAQASLPIRYWATATDTASDVVMKAVCGSVISEGGADLQDIPGRQFPSTGALSNATSGCLMVIRCKQQLNSINQNAVVIPTDIDVSVADAGCWVNVRLNATVTAGTFTDVNSSRSVMEESFAGNAGTDPTINTATGQLLDRFWVPASNTIRTSSTRGLTGKAILCYSHLLGVGDTLSVDYDSGGATTDVNASLKWKEIR